MATIRTFVAIEMPGLVRQALAATVSHLSHLDDRVRWVAPENIHLTLKFLGDVEESGLQGVTRAVESVAARSGPFTLKTVAAGGGPHASKARVVWIHVGGDLDALSELQSGIEAASEELGFPREKRKFLPHLTLGRARRAPVTLPESTPCQSVSFRADRLTVYKSDLRPSGAVYSPLGYGQLSGP